MTAGTLAVEPVSEPTPQCAHCGTPMGTSKYEHCSAACAIEAEREQLRQQIAAGSLRIRRAEGDELARLRAAASRFRDTHPDDVERAARLRPSLPNWKAQKKPRPALTCPTCHEEFVPRDARAKFCSRGCAARSQRKPVEPRPQQVKPDLPVARCEHCGETFRLNRLGQRFCSKSCGGKAMGGRPATAVQIVCEQCGVTFERPKKRSDRKFCSRGCASKATAARQRQAA